MSHIDPESVFTEPVSIALLQKRYSDIDSTSLYYYLEDSGAGEAYFDGSYNSTSKQYEFRITNFMQHYIAGNYDSDNILLQIVGANYKGSRLIAGGSDSDLNPESNLRLEIIYTDMEPKTP